MFGFGLVGFDAGLKGFVLSFLIFMFFVLMSGLDFVVHGVLYYYGLQFSFDWAVFLLECLHLRVHCLCGGCGLCILVGFWQKPERFESEFMFVFEYLPVVFWRLAGLPPDDVVWWWMPWYRLFGFWNNFAQLALLSFVFGILFLFWFFTLR